ncbi:MAG: tetratricopeptide repeat protein [Proteobacteria bacterium]|nr:tetratricopeptide repeat protein [Pseudomonadota bacterium]
MKKFVMTVVILLLLLAAAWLTPLLLKNPGLLQLEILGYQVQMTVITAGFFLLAMMLTLWLLWGLLKAPKKLMRQVADYRHQKKFDQGLLAFSEGHWQHAEKLLLKSAQNSKNPQLSYMAAARAALAQQKLEDALAHLDAAEKTVSNPLTIDLTRCEIWLKSGHLQQAKELLETVLNSYPNNPRAVRMMLQVSEQLKDYQSIKKLLPKAHKLALVDKTQTETMRDQATREGLMNAIDEQQLLSLWSDLSRKQQKFYLHEFCESGLRIGAYQVITDEIERAQKYHFDEQLIDYWSQLPHNLNHRLKVAEKWHVQHPKNRSVLLCLGQLYMAKNQWAEAKEALQKALILESDSQVNRLLAETYQQLNEPELALEHYSQANNKTTSLVASDND